MPNLFLLRALQGIFVSSQLGLAIAFKTAPGNNAGYTRFNLFTGSFAFVSVISLVIGSRIGFSSSSNLALLLNFCNWIFFAASFGWMMGGAFAWYNYSEVACPWTTNGKQWPCIVGDILTVMDLICWVLFCISLFITIRQVSNVVVHVGVQPEPAENRETQVDAQKDGAQV